MSDRAFLFPDEPTESSLRLLTRSLRDDCIKKEISPKTFAHRSRVIRQQTELLALRTVRDAGEESKRLAKRRRKASRPLDHREEGGEA